MVYGNSVAQGNLQVYSKNWGKSADLTVPNSEQMASFELWKNSRGGTRRRI